MFIDFDYDMNGPDYKFVLVDDLPEHLVVGLFYGNFNYTTAAGTEGVWFKNYWVRGFLPVHAGRVPVWLKVGPLEYKEAV